MAPKKDLCAQYTKYYSSIRINFVFSLVDKCARVRYNLSTFNRGYTIMTAFATAKSGYCTSFAVAYTSARNMDILDTAVLAVSILLDPILSVLRT